MVPIVKTGQRNLESQILYFEPFYKYLKIGYKFGLEIWPHSVFGRFKMVNSSDHDLKAHMKGKKKIKEWGSRTLESYILFRKLNQWFMIFLNSLEIHDELSHEIFFCSYFETFKED